MTEELTAAINETAAKLRLIERDIKLSDDWLKIEALKRKYQTLDQECLNLITELKLLTEDSDVKTR